MKQFAMSQYINAADLYDHKAEYYEKLFRLCAEQLIEFEYVHYIEESDSYYWAHTGEDLDEGIN